MFEWWRKSFFFLQLIIYVYWNVVVVVTCCRIGWFKILHWKHEYHFFFFLSVVVSLLFFSSQFSIDIGFAISFTPFFRYQYTLGAILWQMNLEEERKNTNKVFNIYIQNYVGNSIDNKKIILKESIEKVFVLLCLTELMKHTFKYTICTNNVWLSNNKK